MAERRVVAADEEDAPDIIDHVGYITTKTTSGGSTDQFTKNAEDVKSFAGTSPTFKRRITGQLKKVYEGTGGAGTKRVDEQNSLTGYDAFEVVEPNYNLDYLAKLYELSAPHYAAVNAKVANIVGLGYKFVETGKTKRALEKAQTNKQKYKRMRSQLDDHRDELIAEFERFNKEDTFTEILEKVWRDYEVTGNGYIEISRKKNGDIGYIGHIPATTLRIRRRRDGFVQMSGMKVQFFANYGAGFDDDGNAIKIPNPVGTGVPNEVIHVKNYSPTSSYYGVPDIIAAKQAVAGNEFAARFNLDYFENKAVPRYAIILKGAKLGVQAEEDLLSFFETSLKGQNHRSIYIPLPPDTADNSVDLRLEAIEAGVQDASFINYRKANLSDILMAHRVPSTKISVSEGASVATARDADKTFKEQVCEPKQSILETKLNKFVRELSDAFELKLNEMTLTDEDTQSKIYERWRKNGVLTGNEVRMILGYSTVEDGDELFDLNGASKKAAEAATNATTTRSRDAQRSASATDTAGEARNAKGDGRASP